MPVTDSIQRLRASLIAPVGVRTIVWALGGAILVVLAVLWGTVVETTNTWRTMSTYMYAWLVLPTLAYLLWHNRVRLVPLSVAPAMTGIALAAIMGAGWVLANAAGVILGQQLAMIGGICAIVLAALGWRMLRLLWPFLAMLLLLVPLGDLLLVPLKHLTVAMLRAGTGLAGLSFTQDGFLIAISGQRYIIIDDCAGLGYVLLGLFLGSALALMIYRSPLRILGLTLLGGATGIFANGLRVNAIVLYDHFNGTQMELSSHSYFEWPAVAVGFVLLFVVFSRLKLEKADTVEEAGAGFSATKPGRCIVAAGFATILMIAAPLYWQTTEADTHLAAEAELPEFADTLANWRKDTAGETDWAPVALDPRVVAVAWRYMSDDDDITAYMAETAVPGVKISAGAIDFSGGDGWMVAWQKTISLCGDATGCAPMVVQKLKLRRKKQDRYVYAVYEVDGRLMASALDVRLGRAWARLKGEGAIVRLYVIGTSVTERSSDEKLGEAEAGTLLDALIRGAGVPQQ